MRRLLILLTAAGPMAFGQADTILHGGKIVTVDRSFSVQQAVAIKDGRIVGVGSDQAVLGSDRGPLAERGPNTKVIDLHGRTVLPGLFDGHVHALEAGLSEFRHKLPRLDSFAAIQTYIRERAKVTPKGEWIKVPRTFPTRLRELRMPTREVLDVDRDHPVVFDASYVLVLNSEALRLCGITRDTPNPPRGVVAKDEHGEPNGILRNAPQLLKGVAKERGTSESEQAQALEEMLERYAAAGITSIGERAASKQDIAVYHKLKASGKLPIRVALTWWLDVARPQDELIREIETAPFKTRDGDHWLRFESFKVNFDGGMTIGTAYQRQPYGPRGFELYGLTDAKDRGQLFASPEKFLAVMRAARDRGWQLSAHDQGGGAVDLFLETMEALDRERSIAPTRSHWIHASFQSQEAIDKAKKLGLLADVQSPWLYLDGPALEKVFGLDGLKMFFPLRSYLDAGIVIAGGSDHMIGHDKNDATNPYNPFLNMWVAVTRTTKTGRVIHPEQKISREEALKMHTIWGAYLQFEEDAKGSIERGKLADLVVIDRDYLQCPEDEIRRIEPLMTMVEGKIVYRARGSF